MIDAQDRYRPHPRAAGVHPRDDREAAEAHAGAERSSARDLRPARPRGPLPPVQAKKKSKAERAREAGLEPLADWIWNCGHGTEQPLPGQTLELWAFTFRNAEKGVNDVEAVLEGAQDILTERLAEDAGLRQQVRDAVFEKGCRPRGKGERPRPPSKFEHYFDHHETVSSLLEPQHSHRYLAMRRGGSEGELALSIGGATDDRRVPGPPACGLRGGRLHACRDSPGAGC